MLMQPRTVGNVPYAPRRSHENSGTDVSLRLCLLPLAARTAPGAVLSHASVSRIFRDRAARVLAHPATLANGAHLAARHRQLPLLRRVELRTRLPGCRNHVRGLPLW